MAAPLAYYLTWTTYGTRLHGDDRGTVDREHNRTDQPYLLPNRGRRESMQRALAQAPFLMANAEREVVERAIEDHCEIRGWVIHAMNVRTNHVHIVVNCRDAHSPEQAMAQLKSWGTRRLLGAGLIERGRRVWTDHGSTRWVNDPGTLIKAVDYVLNCQ